MLLLCLLLAQVLDPRAEEGERLYADLEFEQAIVVLQDAIADNALPADQRARALLFLGLSQAQIGKSAHAQLSLTSAFRADPAVVVPAGQPPKIQSLIDTARAQVEAVISVPPPPEVAPPTVVPVPSVAPADVEPSSPAALPLLVGIPGAVVLASGGVIGGVSMMRWQQANDAQTTQRQAVALGGEANLLLAVAAVAAGVGVAAIGVAVAVAVIE